APVPLQLAYHAWVTNTRTVLQQHGQPEQPRAPSAESAAERSNVLQRAVSTLRFLQLLCQALVDGLTQWLDTCTQEHTDMSNVLLLERCIMAQRLAKASPGARRGAGEEINQEFPNELYGLAPEEFLQELSSRGSFPGDSRSRASRQVHSYPPRGGRWQCHSLEDVASTQQFLAVPQQRRRTASELLRSR
ncbi:PIEZ1 protein, partial [Regulus satrapa]|nr:PIEZ1 protein [Regulus satrapa]